MGTKKYRFSSKSTLIKRLCAIQEIAVDLLKEKDPHNLLDIIVKKAMELMVADAGSLYIKGKGDELFFEIYHNHSVPVKNQRHRIPIQSEGIATYSFKNAKIMRITDAYNIPATEPYKFNELFDQQANYRTYSMLVCPLQDSHGEKLGVIQIINHKNHLNEDWPTGDEAKIKKMPEFTEEDEELIASFASLASAALENSNLYKSIENLLEGFVRSSVEAIETRDLATCGHSERVAILTTELARVLSDTKSGPAAQILFTEQQLKEIRYASLLHDFGKISVNERVLLKSKKLYPEQQDSIKSRMKESAYLEELELFKQLISKLKKEKRPPTELDLARINLFATKYRQSLDKYWNDIVKLNHVTILDHDNTELLNKVARAKVRLSSGDNGPLLNEDELSLLSIPRGSLSKAERDSINEHVCNTYKFLKGIPWTKGFENIADIAHAHHEKLDGTGYPRKLLGNQIPIQSKIMTVTDIFDALVAMDRPYKKAISFDRALDILYLEVKQGKLEKFLVDLFVEAKIFERQDFMALVGPTGIKKAA